MFKRIKDSIKSLDKRSSFKTVWKVNPGDKIDFCVEGKISIDWGDGCKESTNKAPNSYPESSPKYSYRDKPSTDYSHVYADKGEYTVSISTGMTYFSINHGTADKLIEIKQWGQAQWKSMINSFQYAKNMVCTATDTPDTSEVDCMWYTFQGCAKFNTAIEHWPVSKVNTMDGMLDGAVLFNQSLAKMDTKAVKEVDCMLRNTPAFDQDMRDFKLHPEGKTDYMFGAPPRPSFGSRPLLWDAILEGKVKLPDPGPNVKSLAYYNEKYVENLASDAEQGNGIVNVT